MGVVTDGAEGEEGRVMLLEERHRHRRLRRVHSHHKHSRKRKHEQRVLPDGVYGPMNTSNTAVAYPDKPSKCSISNSSACPELRERFMNIAGGIADAQEELEFMLGNLQSRCLEI